MLSKPLQERQRQQPDPPRADLSVPLLSRGGNHTLCCSGLCCSLTALPGVRNIRLRRDHLLPWWMPSLSLQCLFQCDFGSAVGVTTLSGSWRQGGKAEICPAHQHLTGVTVGNGVTHTLETRWMYNLSQFTAVGQCHRQRKLWSQSGRDSSITNTTPTLHGICSISLLFEAWKSNFKRWKRALCFCKQAEPSQSSGIRGIFIHLTFVSSALAEVTDGSNPGNSGKPSFLSWSEAAAGAGELLLSVGKHFQLWTWATKMHSRTAGEWPKT